MAIFVGRDGAEVTKEEVYEVLADRFAKRQFPEEVIVQQELPRTSVGKLEKNALRDQWPGQASASSYDLA